MRGTIPEFGTLPASFLFLVCLYHWFCCGQESGTSASSPPIHIWRRSLVRCLNSNTLCWFYTLTETAACCRHRSRRYRTHPCDVKNPLSQFLIYSHASSGSMTRTLGEYRRDSCCAQRRAEHPIFRVEPRQRQALQVFRELVITTIRRMIW